MRLWNRTRPMLSAASRTMVALAVLAGTVLLLSKPAPQSGRIGRGKYSHTPNASAMHEGFEVRDLSARSLAVLLAVLAASAAMLVGIVFGMIALFASWDHQANAGLTAEQTANIIPPQPLLQVYPVEQLQRQRARENRELQGYSWVGSGQVQAHVPIARAMRLVVGHSLDDAP